ncbi:FecCD family ABC transporter permease [Paenibacillus lignilyticus]|uniref:Iron ABC transporter permease n=1 Tax=Paenibacillus lignilyticus TaxID=1172615 RepID=A0ABS5CH04_9BACL|nr:iron ABC transporter permease [Paenibacillus lignilyticus]MBP3965164.1 iron ABC transporter permease [Paenibacillus lignilyticus]
MRKRLYVYGGAAMLLLAVSVVVSLSIGSSRLPLLRVWGILIHQLPWMEDPSGLYEASDIAIVTQLRLSRVVLAMLVGACLALAGSGFQGVLRNPLADPFTLGVATGCSVGAAFMIVFGYQSVIGLWTVPLVAFTTGIVTLFIVFALSRARGAINVETLILSGVIVQAFLGAFVTFMVSMSQGVINEALFWLMGSLSARSWEHVQLIVPFLIVGLPVMIRYGQHLNLFVLGERHAAHLGINVERTKLIVLIVSTLLTAVAVSIAGVVGFVGLVVPHLLRLLVGPDYRFIIPLSAVGGAIYLLWADTLARTALSPKEISLGVVTALIGAPFFGYLLYRRKVLQGGSQA